MYRLLYMGMDVLSSLLLIPLLLLICRFTPYGKKRVLWKTGYILFALYLAAVFSATGMPTVHSRHIDVSINWLPLIDIVNSPVNYLINTVLNIILFVPLGMFLPFLWAKFRSWKQIAAAGFALSLMIELSQIFTFRLTDIDDLLTNTVGAVLGFGILFCFLRVCHMKLPEADGEKDLVELVINIGVVLLTAFFV